MSKIRPADFQGALPPVQIPEVLEEFLPTDSKGYLVSAICWPIGQASLTFQDPHREKHGKSAQCQLNLGYNLFNETHKVVPHRARLLVVDKVFSRIPSDRPVAEAVIFRPIDSDETSLQHGTSQNVLSSKQLEYLIGDILSLNGSRGIIVNNPFAQKDREYLAQADKSRLRDLYNFLHNQSATLPEYLSVTKGRFRK